MQISNLRLGLTCIRLFVICHHMSSTKGWFISAFVNVIDQGQWMLIAAKRIPEVSNLEVEIRQIWNYPQLCQFVNNSSISRKEWWCWLTKIKLFILKIFILCKNISVAIKKGDPQVPRELYCGYQISVTGQCNFTKLNNKHSFPTTPNKK